MGFLFAPMAPVLVYSLLMGENFGAVMIFGAVIAYAFMLVLGLPLVALLNWRRKISLLTSAVGAVFVGLVIWAAFFGTAIFESPTPMDAKDIFATIFSFCLFVGLGLIAGVTWWIIVTSRRSTPL